jgi:hypothetical protein
MLNILNRVDWEVKIDKVKGCWDEIENKLLIAVDKLVPLQELKMTYAPHL